MRIPTRRQEKERFMQEEDPHMTQETFDRLTRELARLERDRKPAAEEVSRTAAMGDLSENAAYTYAKQHLRSILTRITRLQLALARAVIIAQGPSDGVIRLGSTVTVSVSGGSLSTWSIVGEREARPMQGRISHLSPVGNALLGHKVGEKVCVRLVDREVVYEVVKVV